MTNSARAGTQPQGDGPRPLVWLGLMGGGLTVVNNLAMNLGFGFALMPVVAMTTPFVFAIAKQRFPRLATATAIYVPVVLISIFTLNLGPPGVYKLLFLAAPLLYDGWCALVQFRRRPAVWKLHVATVLYVAGLVLMGYLAFTALGVELPMMSQGAIYVYAFLVGFSALGMIATWMGWRVYGNISQRTGGA
ncbi:MAG: hypothetical protein L6413_00595 [Coriobacteriia bacterium]|nr:hypothetical protein [Coriobacteriia bacterium]